MRQRYFVFLAAAFLLVCGQARGTDTVYVSDFTGHRILKLEIGQTTTVTPIHDGSENGELPEGIVFGPDGKIYFCDSLNNRIFRVKPDGTEFERIYLGSMDPKGPEGPVFLGHDLYFNTRDPNHTGIWKIANATGPVSSLLPPVNVIPKIGSGGTGSTWGEGLAFTPKGDLLIVDRSGNRVLVAHPPLYNSASVLIGSGLDTPVGVATNRAGDIFVANRGAHNIKRFNSSGVFQEVYASFVVTEGTSDDPVFMRFDSDGNLFVATLESISNVEQNGKLWEIDPFKTRTLIMAQTCDPCTVPPWAGVALPPTSTSKTLHFGPGTNVSKTADFLSDSYTLTFDQVFSVTDDSEDGGFDVTVTRAEKLPSDETSHLSSDENCFLYEYDGGFCVEYDLSTMANAGTNYKSPAGVHLLIHFQNTGRTFDPVVGHIPDGSTTGLFEDITSNFSTEPTGGGNTDGLSPFMMINKALKHANAVFCGFNSPIPPGSVHKGQGLPVKIIIRDGNCQTGAFITDVTEHISVTDSSDAFQTVMPAGGSNTGNLFRAAGHQLIYNLKVNFGPGTFTINVWGDGASPATVQMVVVP